MVDIFGFIHKECNDTNRQSSEEKDNETDQPRQITCPILQLCCDLCMYRYMFMYGLNIKGQKISVRVYCIVCHLATVTKANPHGLALHADDIPAAHCSL